MSTFLFPSDISLIRNSLFDTVQFCTPSYILGFWSSFLKSNTRSAGTLDSFRIVIGNDFIKYNIVNTPWFPKVVTRPKSKIDYSNFTLGIMHWTAIGILITRPDLKIIIMSYLISIVNAKFLLISLFDSKVTEKSLTSSPIIFPYCGFTMQ